MQTLPIEAEYLNTSHERELGDIKISWAKPPSLASLKKNLEDATIEQQVHVNRINKWLDNLNVEGAAKPPKRDGRSAVQPAVIRRQAEWRYSSLTEPFMAPNNLFKANPVTWDDKHSATQNQLVLNKQFNRDIDRGEFIDEYVRTAVNQGTVILRVGWEYSDEIVEEEIPTFDLVPDPEFEATLLEIAELQETNPNAYEYDVPDELKAALEASMQSPVPLRPVITGSEIVQKSKIVCNKPTIKICDYRNVYIDPTCNGDYSKANFIVYSYESCKADLEKDGRYSNLDKLNLDTHAIVGEADHATSSASKNFNFGDDARKRFVVKEYWGFLDVEGDGVLKPVVCSWVGDTFIWLADNPYPDKQLPFVWVKYMPKTKELYGEPDGALLEEHQAIMGAVTRGMIDILARSANAQTGRRRDMLDAVNRRKYERGDDYEFNGNVDPRQAFFMHKFEEIPQSAQFILQLMNQEAESMTGVKAFSGGLTGNELGDVATAVRGVLDSAAKRELGILRRLASGLVKVARKIAAMNGEFLSEIEVVRITNEQFIPVRRDELNGEFDLELTISTAEEDNAKAQELAFMLQAAGDTIDSSVKKMMLAEMFRLRKMPDLAKTIEEYEPEPDPMEQQMMQLQLEEQQMKNAKLRSEAEENMAEAELDRAKAQDVVAQADQRALDFIEQESGVKQERDLEKLGQQARANMMLEDHKQSYKLQEQEQNTRNKLLANYIKSTRTTPKNSNNSGSR